MEMSGQVRIEAPREKVWAALNDSETLKVSIPGCESLEADEDSSFSAKVKAKVGPISAKFSGTVTLSDIVAPESYTISGEGKGGAAGFAKGGARIRLEEDGEATLLNYEVEAKVGGKMAQLGARLIDSTARKMADDFFARFSEQVAPTAAAEPAAEENEIPGDTTPQDAAKQAVLNARRNKKMSPMAWVATTFAIIVLLWIIFGQ